MFNHNLHVLGTVRTAQKPPIIYTLHIVNRSLYSDKFFEHYIIWFIMIGFKFTRI